MKPVETNRSDVKLAIEAGGIADEIPAERVRIFRKDDPDERDEPEPGFESVWIPDDGERRALVNGAPIHLRVWGTGHPPVALFAGEPIELRSLISKAHVDRAVGFWYRAISDRMLEEDGIFPRAEEVLELWHQALEETRELKDDAAERKPRPIGENGHSPAGLELPPGFDPEAEG